jgi:outer membrane autotransporter protein
MQFCRIALFACLMLLSAPAKAATVDFNSGTFDSVIGNPSPSYPNGIGGITGSLSPAYDNNSNASANIVNVTGSGATVNHGIYGGYHRISATGNALANDNQVNISTFSGGSSLWVHGGYAEAAVNGSPATVASNYVAVSGGKFNMISGGYARTLDGAALASGNTVDATGITADYIYGGYAGSEGISAESIGNEVIISNSTVNYTIIGGNVYLYSSGIAIAANNTVIISGGVVGYNVYGGCVALSLGFFVGSGTATSNIIEIIGDPDLTTSEIFGGLIWDRYYDRVVTNMDAFTGNALNVKTSGLTVKGLYNFEYINFFLPSTLTAGETVIIAKDKVRFSQFDDGSGKRATVNVGIEGASSPLRKNDTVTLISAGTLIGTVANAAATVQATQGVTLKYEFGISQVGNKLLLTVPSDPKLNEQTKALSEGFISGLSLVNLGADLAAGQGMSEAVSAASRAAREGVSAGPSFGAFGAISGGKSRFNTGSHVDVSSISLMVGLSCAVDVTPGRLTLGAFFEYGSGSYETFNSFSNAASVHGDGDIYSIGGGILGRMDFVNTGPGHIYAEASLRVGEVNNEFDSSDLKDSQGLAARYESSSAYYGFHIGTGYEWNITQAASLDLYAKYFWTRQGGDSVTLSTGDPVEFEDADSSRLRLGGRLTYAASEHVSPYVGAAYEREFGGKARAATNGFAIQAPSLRGDTGVGELCLTLKPSATLPISFDLGVQGYVGKREGITGSLQVKVDF